VQSPYRGASDLRLPRARNDPALSGAHHSAEGKFGDNSILIGWMMLWKVIS